MNAVYFLLPFLLVATFALSENAFAQVVEQGSTWDNEFIEVNNDGKEVYKLTTTQPRVQNDIGLFVDHIFTENATALQVETAHGTVSLDKTSCEFTFYNGEIVDGDEIFTDDIILVFSNPQTSDTWIKHNAINNASCQASFDEGSQTLIAKKETVQGVLEYKYNTLGTNWKTQLEFTNLSSTVNTKFSFFQDLEVKGTEASLGNDTTKFSDLPRDGLVNALDKATVDLRNGKIININNDFMFDFDIGYTDLNQINFTNIPNTENTRISFDYTADAVVLAQGESILIDPTIIQNSAMGSYHQDAGNNGACDAWTTSHNSTITWVSTFDTASTNDCRVADMEFNLSTVSNSTSVTSVTLDLEISVANSNENIDIVEIDVDDLSTRTGTQRFASIIAGTEYTDARSYSSTGTISQLLGGNVNTDVQSALSSDGIFSLGFRTDPFTQEATLDQIQFHSPTGTNPPELTIVYEVTIPPDVVGDIVADDVMASTVDLNWTEPDLQGETLINYLVNSTTPHGIPTTFLANTTNSYYNATGLAANTDYSFRVSALTAGGYNTTAIEAFDKWELDDALYDSNLFDLSSQSTNPTGVTFSANGTKMYILDYNATAFQYTLSTAWNVLTSSYDSISYDASSEDTQGQDILFSLNGSKMFILGTSGDGLYEYDLSNPWDISSSTYSTNFLSTAFEDGVMTGYVFNANGTKGYGLGEASDIVYQYTWTTPFDVISASYASKSALISAEETAAKGIAFRSDGTKFFIVGTVSADVYQYTFGTPEDITTRSYDSILFNTTSQDTNPEGLFFSPDGSKFYTVGNATDTVYQYLTAPVYSTIVNVTTSNIQPPTGLVVTPESITQLDLDWTAPATGDSPTGYKIERETPVGGGWSTIVADTGTSTVFYNNTGLTASTQYNYRVSTISINGTSAASTAAANYTHGVPYQVTGLTAINPMVSSIDLEWTAPFANGFAITGYKIERESPTGGGFSTLVNDTGNTNIYYNNTGLTSGTQYNYRVGAWNSQGVGIASAESSNSTLGGAPTALIVYPEGTSTTDLNLEWVAPSPLGAVNGYKIEREAPVGGGFATIQANTTNLNAYYNDTGLVVNTYYNYRVSALLPASTSAPSNTYSQTTYHLSDAVDDLNATDGGFGSSALEWTVPTTLYGYLLGYMINYTTPLGDPQSIYVNSTGDSAVTAIVGLPVNDYSFRVAAVTIHGINATGNIANVTTVQDTTIGFLDADFSELPSGTLIPITFSLVSVDNDTSDLQVFYDSAYELECNFFYKYARNNDTYGGLTENTISGSSVYTNFTINDPQNEIIDVKCQNVLDTVTNGTYQISEGGIPFFEQAEDFNSGVFGTQGFFGFFDLLTLIVVIISMIGFNRYNPAVGAILMIMMLGVLSYYGMIELATTVLGVLALVIVLAITTVRKS